jgi:hypothetical protein
LEYVGRSLGRGLPNGAVARGRWASRTRPTLLVQVGPALKGRVNLPL